MVIYDPGEHAIVEMRTRLAPLTRDRVGGRSSRRRHAARSGPLSSIAVTEQHAANLRERRGGVHRTGPPYGPGLALVEAERNVLRTFSRCTRTATE